MERELWIALYRMLRAAARRAPRPKRVRVGDAVIVAVYVWAALHDRPVSWATRPCNWPRELLDFALPSQSTMSRRLRTTSMRDLMAALHAPLGGGSSSSSSAGNTLVKTIDAKPLPVGAYSVAKDARWGRGTRGHVRGYKLHALYGDGPLPIAWEVVPMNASEQRVARRLLRHLRGAVGYVLADRVYDVNDLYARAADVGHQLLAPRKRPDAGLGHRAHHPNRLRAIEMLEGPCPTFGRQLYALRATIERRFGRLTNFGGGLAPLPNWVRTLPRVRLWVHAKLLIDAVRWQLKARLAA